MVKHNLQSSFYAVYMFAFLFCENRGNDGLLETKDLEEIEEDEMTERPGPPRVKYC